MEIKNVVIIGSGNVATHLGRALRWSRYSIVQVCSRSLVNAQTLATELQAEATNQLSDIIPDADLFLITVSDDAIEQVAQQIKVTGIVAHTSGSATIELMKNCSPKHGVFYPLQTFTKDKDVELEGIPILVEGNTQEVDDALFDLGNRLTSNAMRLTTEQRLKLHIAAVFACNFTNHMYAISSMILQESGLEFTALRHLVNETNAKAMSNQPADVQTGPAVRGDTVLIERHIELLKDHPKFSEIYKLLSETIKTLDEIVHENQ